MHESILMIFRQFKPLDIVIFELKNLYRVIGIIKLYKVK
jgi:hypothetical protein